MERYECACCHAQQIEEPPHGWAAPCPSAIRLVDVQIDEASARVELLKAQATATLMSGRK